VSPFIYIIVGFLVGVVFFLITLYFLGGSVIKKSKVYKKLSQVKDIIEKQNSLNAQISMPQKNSLDGKYKNTLISEIKLLEEEKLKLLKSILDDGYDPTISTLDSSGVVSNIKLSDLISNIAKKPEDALNSIKNTYTKPQKKHAFTVIYGGKKTDDTVH
jgi:hypothetical protein